MDFVINKPKCPTLHFPFPRLLPALTFFYIPLSKQCQFFFLFLPAIKAAATEESCNPQPCQHSQRCFPGGIQEEKDGKLFSYLSGLT